MTPLALIEVKLTVCLLLSKQLIKTFIPLFILQLLLKVPVKATDQCVLIKGGKLYCYYLFYNNMDSEHGQVGTSKTGP